MPTSLRISSVCRLLIALTSLGAAAFSPAAIPAFPGAEGYGAYATGGRGGDVYHVTNLNASGTGSFATAISSVPAAGRTIVFDVSGYIRFPSGSNGVRLSSSKVTIAGQTAPGDGVGFYNNFFLISGDDIVIRHLRFRMGKYGSGGDCIDLDSGSLNSIFDHVSMEFSTDENMSSYGSPPENLTLQYSLNAWGLESHSCGGLWDQNHASSHHNLWAHNHTRNPKARPNGLLEWINNVTFDWDIGFIMGDSYTPSSWKANVRSNYFICPPGNTKTYALEKGWLNSSTTRLPTFSIYLDGNLMDKDGDGSLNGVDYGYAAVQGSEFNPSETVSSYATNPDVPRYYKNATPFTGSNAGVAIDTPLLAYKKIVSNAGALRLDAAYPGTLRDEVDTILFTKLATRTHFHVTRESDAGASASGFGTLTSTPAPVDTDRDGMPDVWETALGFNAGSDDHNTVFANSGGLITAATFFPASTPAGYTYLEEYLHFLAIPHATVAKRTATDGSANDTFIDIDLRRYTGGFSSSPVFTLASASGGTATLQPNGYTARFVPTLNTPGRGKFSFTVTDSAGSTWTQQFAVLISASSIPQDLRWKGGNASNAWDGTSTNWRKASEDPSLAGNTVFSAGDNLLFDNNGSISPAVNLTTTLSPGSMTVDASQNYTFSGTGALTGTMPLVKSGTGTLTLNNTGANAFSGGATLNAGTLYTNNTSGLGSGMITLAGATFALTNAANLTVANAIAVTSPSTITVSNNTSFSGAFSGPGDLSVSSAIFTPTGTWAGYTGTLTMANNGSLRFNQGANSWGAANAAVDAGASSTIRNRATIAATTITLGALTGGTGSFLRGSDQDGGVTDTYVIGGLNQDTTFAGTITNGSGATTPHVTALTKTGTGTFTLSGTSTYTGATAVSAGWLVVSGTLGATAVTVASGAGLGGGGTINGQVTAGSGAILSPGTAPFTGATLTLGSGLSLSANTLYYDLSGTTAGPNDKIVLANGGTLALAGNLYFQFLLLNGTLAAGTYDLVSGATNSTASSVTLTHNLPADSRQTFALSRAAAGSNPSYLRLTVSGSTANLVWTGANNGGTWDTQTTSNWTGGPTATFFNSDTVTFNDTATTVAVNIGASVSPRLITVNNTTTAYTFDGTGAITGSGQLVKSGTGTLTIANANTYTGGTTINTGSPILLANDIANASGLGTGPITFNGGTLSMSSNLTTFNSATYTLVVPTGQTGTLNADSRCDLYGTLSGGGTLNLRIPWVRTTLYADWSAFTGTINVTTDGFAEPGGGTPANGDLRMGTSYNFPGFPNALVILNAKTSAYYTGTLAAGAGTTIAIGQLSGTATTSLLGGSTPGRALTYRIGGNNGDATFAGSFSEQSGGNVTALVKTGTGTLTLSGACTHAGSTTVEQGILRITGSIANTAPLHVTGTATLDLQGGDLSLDSVSVDANASLTGYGSIEGELLNDGFIACTAGGNLLVTGDIVNNGTMRFTGGTSLLATGAFVNNGVLDLMTAGGTLPPNLVNNGTVIDASAAKLSSWSQTGNAFTLRIVSYTGHSYKLQVSTVLGTWTDVQTQTGSTGQELVFTHDGGAFTRRFYRILAQ